MAMAQILFVLVLQVIALSFTVMGENASGLEVKLDSYGNYTVLVGGEEWLRSAPTSFTVDSRHYSTEDGSLNLLKKSAENGTDVLGPWKAQNFYYQPSDVLVTIKVSIKFYIQESCVIFSQHFLDPVMGTSVGDKNGLSSAFPSFYTEAGVTNLGTKRPSLGFLAFGGIMFGDTQKRFGIWGKDSSNIASGLDSGPVALFTKSGDTLIMSSFSQFMAASTVYSKVQGQEVVSWGIMGMAMQIPQDFVYSTIIYHSPEGVNKAFTGWGSVMMRYYRKDLAYRDSDLTVKYLGYLTDNGAYYYYNTEKNKTYEQTILDVKAYADKCKIPYKYVQFDSWFYYKGPKKGVTKWTSMPKIFPSGLQSMWEKTGWPVSAHNRWWSDKVVYAKQNGGKFNFILEEKSHKAVPIDQTFWDYLMKTSKEWGLITYEQDWLNVEFDYITAMYSDVTLGRTWLTQMGAAAAKHGITIQYCMAPSRAALQSLEIPVVTQARASGDYQPGNDNWKIGVSSLFVDAIGVAPIKDIFWTTTDQPGNPYGKRETQPALIALSATLSTGPVGVGDGVTFSNPALIMRSCNADGLLLKPSKPAKAINKQIIEAAFSGFLGEVWSTYSTISGMSFGIILGADMHSNESMSVGPTDAGFVPQSGRTVAYGADIGAGGAAVEFSDSKPLLLKGCTTVQFCLGYITPVILHRGRELLLYGEMSKWVVMSPQRISNIIISSNDVQVELTGAPWEIVVFSLSYGGQFLQMPCLLSSGGRARINVLEGICLPV